MKTADQQKEILELVRNLELSIAQKSERLEKLFASYQSPTKGISVEEAKDEVAREYEKEDHDYYNNWYDVLSHFKRGKIEYDFLIKLEDRATLLYHTSNHITDAGKMVSSPSQEKLVICGLCSSPIHKNDYGGEQKEIGSFHTNCFLLKEIKEREASQEKQGDAPTDEEIELVLKNGLLDGEASSKLFNPRYRNLIGHKKQLINSIRKLFNSQSSQGREGKKE